MKDHATRLFQIGITLAAAAVPAFAGVIATPEPSSVLLLGGGIGVLILIARRKRSRK
jgi:hypothetical protein